MSIKIYRTESNFLIFLFVVLFAGSTSAQRTQKSSYSLLNPVPAASMAEMETDRPDVTESAHTVDAGHFQFESDLFRSVQKRVGEESTTKFFANNFYLKAGISGTTELQLGAEPIVWQVKSEPGEELERSHGFGNFSLRLKQNFLGNKRGNFALAAMPYMRFPTSGYEDSRYEYGLIVPMQLKLAGDWKLGFQLEADHLEDEEDSGMHTEFLQSVSLSHQLIKKVDGIAESYYTYDFKSHHWSNYINAAVQVEVSGGIKLDGGLNYGIQADAGRSCFIGTSIRF